VPYQEKDCKDSESATVVVGEEEGRRVNGERASVRGGHFMRLTRYTDFCIRVLIHVGLKNRALSTTREISENYNISSNHLMKIVYDLNVKGYVETVRGKNGGMRLGRHPEDINIGTLIRETEDEMALVECHSSADQCRISSTCLLGGILEDAKLAFFSVLDRYTLADLLSHRDELVKLLGIEKSAPCPERSIPPEQA
ncbi:MAG: Rrf2 family transcriptional regulator, partial [Rhodospirillaceae bacterium]